VIIFHFIKNYWTQIVFLIGTISALIKLFYAYRNATRCSLRNDILEIWDKCKDTQTITRYQLESYIQSRDLYFKLRGDGFVHILDDRITKFKVID